jgi:hypothetical protein
MGRGTSALQKPVSPVLVLVQGTAASAGHTCGSPSSAPSTRRGVVIPERKKPGRAVTPGRALSYARTSRVLRIMAARADAGK